MPLTRLFRSGNSQAVRIPAEIAYDNIKSPLQISRVGDVITIFPIGVGLGNAVAALRLLPKPPVERREPIELPTRD